MITSKDCRKGKQSKETRSYKLENKIPRMPGSYKPRGYMDAVRSGATEEELLALDGYSLIDLKKAQEKAILSLNFSEYKMWLQIERGIL